MHYLVVRIHVLYRDSGTREKRFKRQSTWSSLRGCRSSFHRQPRKTHFTVGKFQRVSCELWKPDWNVWWTLHSVASQLFLIFQCGSLSHRHAKRHVRCMYKPFQRSVPVMLCGLSLICPHNFLIAAFHHSISVDLTFLRLNVLLF